MPAAVAITPTSGNITATKDFCKVNITGASVNDSSGFDPTKYPTEPAFTYYITFELASAVVGKSYVFTPDSTGAHEFDNYVFPQSGSWTVRLSNASSGASVATASVTVN